ncbi:PREDICTED: LOW QUALITY PROTEIN: ADAMTS-like protein 1 [Branchiostoma belcheri]|uniref:LOW QUALITY PROTEIN: ADAMTS-like protein 1 n=1 Tax=Branchiostoma belcheri TaxID=7741 RepID=A0A6P4Y379_BRABE|nr:PREDICTED: LOW QUALITY PROTEIN: ADAMTS-like protein 1 [Branchiostoma belcheri]
MDVLRRILNIFLLILPTVHELHPTIFVHTQSSSTHQPPRQTGDPFMEIPRFVVGEWSTCSTTCGPGVQRRPVRCKLFLPLFKTMVGDDLPFSRCPAIVPPNEQRCNLAPCHADINVISPLFSTDIAPSAAVQFTWRYEGYTPCSASCIGGTQHSLYVCVRRDNNEKVGVWKCADIPKPELLTRDCNVLIPCGARWEVETISGCSATCGGGVERQKVTCVRSQLAHHQAAVRVREEECKEPRPPTEISCNDIPCSPEWNVGPWGECSAPCGRGIEKREVHCREKQGLGYYLDVEDWRCHIYSKPPQDRPCNVRECSLTAVYNSFFKWEVETISGCSATCGGGVERQKVTCVRSQLAHHQAAVRVREEECKEPRPPTEISCNDIPCSPEWNVGPWGECSAPCGRGIEKREVHCREKQGLGWQQNGYDVVPGGRLQIDDQMRLRIDGIRDSDQATYTCVAGPVNDSFTLYLKEPSSAQREQLPKIYPRRANFTQKSYSTMVRVWVGADAFLYPNTRVVIKCPVKNFQRSQIRWQQNGYDVVPGGRLQIDDQMRLRIDGIRDSDQATYTCVAGPVNDSFTLYLKEPSSAQREQLPKIYPRRANFTQKSYSTMVRVWVGADAFLYPNTRVVIKCPVKNFQRSQIRWQHEGEEVTKLNRGVKKMKSGALSIMKMSTLQTGTFTCMAGAARESVRLHLIGGISSETSTPFSPTISPQPRPDELKAPEVPRLAATVPERQQTGLGQPPVIYRERIPPMLKTEGHVVVYVGSPVIAASVESITILCEVPGAKPRITWTKDGAGMPNEPRYQLWRNGSLTINKPRHSDAGSYTCTATNAAGRDSDTSLVSIAEAPDILFRNREEMNLEDDLVSVTVGGKVKVKPGATVTIHCPVRGFPKPFINWDKLNGTLERNANVHPNGSLTITNASEGDQGAYRCEAGNPGGKDMRDSTLILLEHPHLVEDLRLLPRLDALVSANGGVVVLTGKKEKDTIARMTGEQLAIACPIKGFPEPPITWLHNNRVLQQGDPRILLVEEDHVVRITAIKKEDSGLWKCQGKNEAGTASANLTLSISGYSWVPRETSECSATCGNTGRYYRILRCFNDEVQVPDAYCDNIPKPEVIYEPCNVDDCPPRWASSGWTACSVTCGSGVERRGVRCERVIYDGRLEQLDEYYCEVLDEARPVDSRACNMGYCNDEPPRWNTSAWSACDEQCLRPNVAYQEREVLCVASNGTVLDFSECNRATLPERRQECYAPRCKAVWTASDWGECSVTCGQHGQQTRTLSCVYLGTDVEAENACDDMKQPPMLQRCNLIPCDADECTDSSNYCSLVLKLRLCSVARYQQDCCESCTGPREVQVEEEEEEEEEE